MKAKIGPYINYVGPQQIAQAILFWVKEDYENDTLVDKFADFLMGKEPNYSLLDRFCQWIHERRKRTVKVQLDSWDTWSMDHTLAPIILPMLIQLKATKQGSALIADEDLPVSVRDKIMAECMGDEDDPDGTHRRWDYVLDSMIYSFDYLVNLTETYEGDYRKRQEKVQYGFTLFGKYFQALWD